jgi:hypothetical protein
MLCRFVLSASILSALAVADGSNPVPRSRPCGEYVRLFAPPARAYAFRFSCSEDPIDSVARFYRTEWPSPEPRSWTIERLAAGDAFDRAALFDRSRMARLYGARQPRIARGPVSLDGRVVEVVMLMSPYPAADLGSLREGTLIMTVQVPP